RWRHDRVERHVVMQRVTVDRRVDIARLQKRRQGRSKADRLACLCKIERLDAKAVTRHHDAACVTLVDHESEHAVEAIVAFLAPGVPGLEDDLRVACREESVALSL